MSITGVALDLVGEDGNAFAIMGRAGTALKRAGLYETHWDNYYQKATEGDYDNLLRTTLEFFNCDGEED